MNITEKLCRFATELSYEQFNRKVVEHAKIAVLDTTGVMLGGSATEPGRAIIDFVVHADEKREASIVGVSDMTSHQGAALVNGSLAEILELQDGHRDSGLHPSSVIPATAMALSEYATVNGREFVTAIVIGYELMTRIGRAVRLSHVRTGTIGAGIYGAFASAATAGRLVGLDQNRMVDALGIAGYFAPLSLSGNYDGKTIKPVNTGQAAWVGIMSAFLALKGFTGSRDILSELYAETSPKIDESLALSKLGKSFQITNLYLKRFPCCRFIHAAADATLALVTDHPIDPESINNIVVRTFEIATGLAGHTDVNSNYVECQFSIPYVVAAAVMDKQVTVQQFFSERRAEPLTHRLAKKVRVTLDKGIDKQFPNKYAATVTIRMKNGRTYIRHVGHPRGDPENPLTDSELTAKFRQMSMPVLGEKKTDEAVKRILALEGESDIADLVRSLH
jgi:2-methylcitrate dehydratase PrpD